MAREQNDLNAAVAALTIAVSAAVDEIKTETQNILDALQGTDAERRPHIFSTSNERAISNRFADCYHDVRHSLKEVAR
jgi:hypothetical protein